MTNDERIAAIKVLLDGNHPETAAPYDADNEIALGQINLKNVEVDKNTTPEEAQLATDADEFDGLVTVNQDRWITMLSWPTLNLNAGVGLSAAQGIWAGAGGATTRAALIATRTSLKGHSDSEGLGICNIGDIQNARAL